MQWDLLQVFAWGRMIADHSRTMPLSSAVAKTFDGEMCPLCRMVAKAKSQAPSRSGMPELKLDSRIALFCQAAPELIVESPRAERWRSVDCASGPSLGFAPPVPPPRGLPA